MRFAPIKKCEMCQAQIEHGQRGLNEHLKKVHDTTYYSYRKTFPPPKRSESQIVSKTGFDAYLEARKAFTQAIEAMEFERNELHNKTRNLDTAIAEAKRLGT